MTGLYEGSDPSLPRELSKVVEGLGVTGVDAALLVTAVTHPSYKGLGFEVEDYERLEFVGDAVLDLLAAHDLVEEGRWSEGEMTERRKSMVSNEVLSRAFGYLKLDRLLRAPPQYSPSLKDKANVVEALFGAVFLSPNQGYDACRRMWRALRQKIGLIPKKKVRPPNTREEEINREAYLKFYESLDLTPKNAKSALQELCQKQNLPLPQYEVVSVEGPPHDPTFTVKVTAVLFDKIPRLTHAALGVARSKKAAELKAAENLCSQVFLPYTTD
ncbi:MAG: ribonuclease III [Promethearchaeota archaeon]